jgi:hypothetical protein
VADYTVGLSQLKTSLGRRIYHEKIFANESNENISFFARSDCGSVRLAALYLDEIVSKCAEGNPDIGLDEIISCAVMNYTGMRNPKMRAFAIYAAAAANSYSALFDLSNEFFFSDAMQKLNIRRILDGECAEFNAGSSRFAYPPKDKTFRTTFGNSREFGVGALRYIDIGADRIEIKSPASTNVDTIVKIISSADDVGLDGRASLRLTRDREEALAAYACARFGSRLVEFQDRPDFVPGRIGQYCSGYDAQEPKSEAYVLLEVDGTTETQGDGSSIRTCAAQPSKN